jgi:hypothetical protein
MSFNTDPSNPRAAIEQYSNGNISYSAAFEVVKTAGATERGGLPGYAEALGKYAVLLVDWSVGTNEGGGIIQSRFGGWIMPPDVAIGFVEEYGSQENVVPAQAAQIEDAYTVLDRYERVAFAYTRDATVQPHSYHTADHTADEGIVVVNPLIIPGIEVVLDILEDSA